MRTAGASCTSRASSHTATTPTTTANSSKTGGGANQTSATVRAMRTAPLMTRVTCSFHTERDWRRLDAAVAAVALLVCEHRFEEMAPPEVGPERFGDPDLGV